MDNATLTRYLRRLIDHATAHKIERWERYDEAPILRQAWRQLDMADGEPWDSCLLWSTAEDLAILHETVMEVRRRLRDGTGYFTKRQQDLLRSVF